MKKILLCSLVAIIFSNCEVSVRKTVAQNKFQDAYYLSEHYSYKEIVKSGMTYGIWFTEFNSAFSYTGYSTSVVNLTKDSLEVALLRKQLSK